MNARKPLGPSTKANTLGAAPTATLAKHQHKLEERLSQAESKIEYLQREKSETQNELGSVQTELRLAAQREAKLRQNLEKWEKSHSSLKERSSKLTSLQTRLDELHKVHEESKARRQKEIEQLSRQLAAEEERRRSEVAEAKKALDANKARAEQAESSQWAMRQQILDLQTANDATQILLQEKEALIGKLQSQKESDKIIMMDAQTYARKLETKLNQQVDTLTTELEQTKLALSAEAQQQLQQAELAQSLLQAENDELAADMEQLEANWARNLVVIVEATQTYAERLQTEATQKYAAQTRAWHMATCEKLHLETLNEERSCQINELIAVVKQVQEERDTYKQLTVSLQDDFHTLMAELQAERDFFNSTWQQSNADDSIRMETMVLVDTDRDQLQAELQDAKSRNQMVEEELDGLHQHYLLQASEAKEMAATLGSVRQQNAALEQALAGKTAEIDRLVSQLGELEMLRSDLRSVREALTAAKKEALHQAEAAKSISASLQNARVAENAWREERDRFAVMLDEAAKYQSLYTELSQQTRHLIERHALAEEEKASLSALNSELLGHTNPMQKIMYMDRVRRELDEIKQDNLALRLQLEQVTIANEDLEKELRSYKAVDMPLNQRPKAEMTRVVRAIDMENLRTVSSTLESGKTNTTKPAHILPSWSSSTDSSSSRTTSPRITPVSLPPFDQTETTPNKPLKKRRSYGNISIYAPEESEEGQDAVKHGQEGEAEGDLTSKPATERNGPRATLVNSGALRKPSASAVNGLATRIVPVATLAREEMPGQPETEQHDTRAPLASGGSKGSSRPSLGVSTLGIKARRVSELVRAAPPPLPCISDCSTEQPNILNTVLPSPAANLADWTVDAPCVPIPLMGHGGYGLAHSTPLARQTAAPATQDQPEATRPKLRRSRYSGAQRVPIPANGLTSRGRTSLIIREENGEQSAVYEDEEHSFQQGWHDDLPDSAIEVIAPSRPQPAVKQQRASVPKPSSKSRLSKKVKPGPMARTIFR